jgi:hypothetical protein
LRKTDFESVVSAISPHRLYLPINDSQNLEQNEGTRPARHGFGSHYARLHVGDKEKWISWKANLFSMAKARVKNPAASGGELNPKRFKEGLEAAGQTSRKVALVNALACPAAMQPLFDFKQRLRLAPHDA